MTTQQLNPDRLARGPRGHRLCSACSIFLLVAGAWSGAAFAQDGPDNVENGSYKLVGVTAPYREAFLGPVFGGRIAAMAVPEGGKIKAGGLLFLLEEGEQRAVAEMAQARAESTLDIKLAEAQWEKSKLDLDRLITLHENSSVSPRKLSDAAADTKVMRLRFQRAKFEHGQAVRAYAREKAKLSSLKVRAPFGGVVVKYVKDLGESVNEKEGVVRLAQLDPLLVEVDSPLSQVQSFHMGDTVHVRPVDPAWSQRLGIVVFIGQVVNPAAQTVKVRIAVDNEDGGWISGLKVAVEFRGRVVNAAPAKAKMSQAGRTAAAMP